MKKTGGGSDQRVTGQKATGQRATYGFGLGLAKKAFLLGICFLSSSVPALQGVRKPLPARERKTTSMADRIPLPSLPFHKSIIALPNMIIDRTIKG